MLKFKGGSCVYKYAQEHLLCALACSSTAPWKAAVDVSFLVTVLFDGDLESETFDGLHVPDNWNYIIWRRHFGRRVR